MKLENLKPTKGSRQDKYRAARGMAQGRGKQAGKGQSGQNKRGGTRPGFEGGQNPIFRRIPKFGFTNINNVSYQVVTLDKLETKFEAGATVNFESLTKTRLINRNLPVKILLRGKLTKALNVTVDAASKTAKAAIEAAGGTVTLIKKDKN